MVVEEDGRGTEKAGSDGFGKGVCEWSICSRDDVCRGVYARWCVCVIVDLVERDCGKEVENGGESGMRGGRPVATGNGF